jgi:hypothetical protein
MRFEAGDNTDTIVFSLAGYSCDIDIRTLNTDVRTQCSRIYLDLMVKNNVSNLG